MDRARNHWLLWLIVALLGTPACESDRNGDPTPGADGGGDTGQPADSDNGDAGDSSSDGGEDPDTGPVTDPKCSIPENKKCNALCNTGCDVGEACLFADGGWTCLTPGTVASGEECDHPDECAAGACAATGDGIPHCLKPCLDNDDCDGGICNAQAPGAEPFKFCTVAAAACVPLIEGECAEGSACYIVQGGTQCLAFGEKGIGDKCSAPNECGANLTCINVAGVSGCVRMCSTKGSDTGTPIACDTMCGVGKFQQIDKDTKTGYCTADISIPTCKPLEQDCDAAQGCYQTSDGWLCLPAGSKEDGETCTTPNDCQKGTFCLGGASKCKVICDPAGNSEECNSFDIPCVAVSGGGGYCDQ